MNADKLRSLQIEPEAKGRSQGVLWVIFIAVGLITAFVGYRAWPRAEGERRLPGTQGGKPEKPSLLAAAAGKPLGSNLAPSAVASVVPAQVNGSVLTVSGYIVNRERIEISPRFLGQVKWIGARKGDYVTNGQVLVLLDDSEYKARA